LINYVAPVLRVSFVALCCYCAPLHGQADKTELEALRRQTVQLYGSGRFSDAIQPATEALTIAERLFGSDRPDTAEFLSNLASVYDSQNQYAKAEPLYVRAVAIREKSLGPDHPDLAPLLHNFAGLYVDQGLYAKAEPLHLRALAINEKVLGPDHLFTNQMLYQLSYASDSKALSATLRPLKSAARCSS
jgi:tetratricopeptide (TPR) repeat protein